MSLEKSAPGHKRRRRAGSTAAVEARSKAQHIAFAPVIFYATVVLRDTGLLALLARASQKGLTPDELSQASELSRDRKSTRLNSSHVAISYAVFCVQKKS